jgi:hypothetical protein
MFEGTLFYETDSWINGSNIPGKPKVTMVYMGGMGAHVTELNRVVDSGFDVFHVEGGDARADDSQSDVDAGDLAEAGR